MGRGLYSGAHDPERNPSYRAPRRSKGRQASPSQPDSGPPAAPPTSYGSTPPSESQRKALRERQLLEKHTAGLPSSDPDAVPDVRRQYENQYGTNLSEPRVRPPRHDLRRPVHLPDPDIDGDPDLQPIRFASDSLPRIADISLRDQGMQRLDSNLSEAVRVIRNLTEAARMVNNSAQGENPETQHHAQQILYICEEALGPWLAEIDSHLDDLIRLAPESRTTTQPQPPQQQPPQSPEDQPEQPQ